MLDDVTAVTVQCRPDLGSTETFPDARWASVDPLGHLHLFADLAGANVVAVFAHEAWVSYRIDRSAKVLPFPPRPDVA